MDRGARTLGYRAGQTLRRYHLPLIRGGMLTAVMIVFVDCMKELPATLLLRPFNFETLATHVYQFASDEMLGEAALGSLTIVVVVLIQVLVLSWMISRSRAFPRKRVWQDGILNSPHALASGGSSPAERPTPPS